MSIVTLVSGGLDSTVMALLVKEEGLPQFPLFIDYGQLARERELMACQVNFQRHALPEPTVISIGGYGAILSSGLTDPARDIYEDAFLPCRNLMFVTIGAAYAYQCNATSVGIGLLNEEFSLFPDQTRAFLDDAEVVLSRSLGNSVNLLAPLMSFSKADVLATAKAMGIDGTYSCHTGTETPCGICVACREYEGLEV